jgi:hypothetical protein
MVDYHCIYFSFKWEDITSCVGSFEGERKDNNSKRKKEVKDNHGCKASDGAYGKWFQVHAKEPIGLFTKRM